MRRFITITILAFMMTLVVGSMVYAQGHMGRGFGGFNKRGMHQKNLENLRLLKLLDVLELSDEQNDRFISSFSKFRKSSKSIREQIESEVTLLAEHLRQDNKSDKIIQNKIDLIVRYKEDFEKERIKFFENIKNILTTEQLGRMIVFQERFERELLEQVRGFRAPKPEGMPSSNFAPESQVSPNVPIIDN